jgi:calcineurin-like phosphoesterase family protein
VNFEDTIREMRVRLTFSEAAPSVLLVVATSDASLIATGQVLHAILAATPLEVVDLGECKADAGPARWAEWTHARAGAAYLLRFTMTSRIEARSFARLLNAERELLRRLAGPLVLLVSRQTERVLREHALDFFTWVATSYDVGEPEELRAHAASLGVAATALTTRQPEEEPIRFLHLSDLHLRPTPGKRYDQDRVLEGLFALLERDRDDFPLDLLFITGDLAQSGKVEEYELVAELLQRLMATTGVPRERVFVVPGNHDVDRAIGRWLLRTLSGDDDAVEFFVERGNRAFHERKLGAYAAGMRGVLGESRALGLGVGAEAVEIVELKGTRLAIASFNSAWFAQGDDDRGKLWLGEPNVRGAIDRIADEEAPFAVALLHHPFDELHGEDRERVEPLFERGFDLVLRGHLHANKTRSILSQRGGFVEQAAPAAYQGSKWPNGCFLGEIRARTRTIRLRPYMFALGADPWVLDARVFPDDEKDGYCHTFTVPAKQRMKSSRSRALRAAAAEVLKNASQAQRQEIAEHVSEDELGRSAESLAFEALGANVSALRTLLGRDASGLAMIDAITRPEGAAGERVAITDVTTLRVALQRAGELLVRASVVTGTRRHRMTAHMATIALVAALEQVVDGSLEVEGLLRVGTRVMHPDIVISDRNAVIRCVIEVKRVTKLTPELTLDAMTQLDRYLAATSARLGALVLFWPRSSTSTSPIEQMKSPGGADVLVLQLQL